MTDIEVLFPLYSYPVIISYAPIPFTSEHMNAQTSDTTATTSITRNELWRLEYRRRRYMEFLSEFDLKQRIKDLFTNLLVLTEDVKIGLVTPAEDGHYLMESFTHTLEELVLRFGPYPNGFTDGFIKRTDIPDPRSPNARKAAEVVKQRKFQKGTYLIKYGSQTYLRDAFEKGVVRISPASTYADPSLNPAIRDNELEITVEALPTEAVMTVAKSRTVKQGTKLEAIGNIKISRTSSTNYYVYCLSTVLAPRLFLDFQADACLLITKPNVFITKVLSAFDRVLSDWAGGALQVNYVDPLRTNTADHDVFTSKHFRYLYQNEIRLIWLPPEQATDLQPILLNVGPLSDCCELLSFE